MKLSLDNLLLRISHDQVIEIDHYATLETIFRGEAGEVYYEGRDWSKYEVDEVYVATFGVLRIKVR